MKLVARALVLVVVLAPGFMPAEAPEKPCADPIPKDCPKVKFLGEDKDCACFVCNPDTKKRKVVCTKDEADKKALYKLREPAPEGSGPAPGTAK